MKKLLTKLRRKNVISPSRITNETVAEHREQILAGGRRFKYPLQYARHRLVFNTIIISLAAVIILAVVGYWQLYLVQNTSDFMYRVAKVLQLPVAVVDGQPVLYSDYLMKYQSSVHYLEQKEQVNVNTDDGKRQVTYIKQQSMQDAIGDAFAVKLAHQLNLSVTPAELQSFLLLQRQSVDGVVSQSTYNAVVLDYYNWTPDQYEYATQVKLLRQKVEYAVDTTATAQDKDIALKLVDNTVDMKTVAAETGGTGASKVTYGTSNGFVPKTNQDGGLALEAATLNKQQISLGIKSTNGDGYYFVRLIDSNNTQVSYEYIHIPLTVFADQLAAIEKTNKVQEFISIPKAVINPAP